MRASELHATGTTALRSLEQIVDRSHTALVVIDVQNDFCHPRGALAVHGNDVSRLEALLPSVASLMQKAHDAKVLIVCCRIVGSPATDSEAWAALSEGVTPALVEDGTWGAAYVRGLPAELADVEIVKHRHSAFAGTDLDRILRERGIRTLVLAGGVTNVCVEGTAREAADRDYHVVVLRDGTAAVRRDLHEMTLYNIDRYFGRVCDCVDVIGVWQAAGAERKVPEP